MMRKHYFMEPFGSALPLKPLPKTNPYNKISENLYLGGIQSSEKNWNDFRLIVNCTKDIPFQSEQFGQRATSLRTGTEGPLIQLTPLGDQRSLCENAKRSCEFGMDSPECIRIPISDTPEECENFLRYIYETNVLRIMNQAIVDGKPVLVHCYAGAQRSCALVACYLIEFYGVIPSVAMEHIRKNRPIAFFGGANFSQAIQRFYSKSTYRS